MSVVDLHPEDLLDKLERGELSESERARLTTHLARCVTCRFEHAVRHDFAAERAGFRLQAPRELLPIQVEQQLPRLALPVARRSALLRRATVIAAAASLLLAGAAFAAVYSGKLGQSGTAPAPRGSVAVASDGPPRSGPRLKPPAEEAAAAAPSSTSAAIVEEPAPALGPLHRGVARGDAEQGSSTERPREGKGAAQLFSAANRARRDADTARAIELYRTLQKRYPDSNEARLSRATLAALLLDRGEPGAALDAFNSYLDKGDHRLDSEALVGRALSLQQLGRRNEEVLAWREILRQLPGTVYAKQAQARLSALGAL